MRLIDSDALRKQLIKARDASAEKKRYGWEFEQDGWNGAIMQIGCEMVDHPIDAEPVRHGNFVGTEYDGYADGNPVYYEWKCSECGCIFEEDEPTYRYCPNCGARMDAK